MGYINYTDVKQMRAGADWIEREGPAEWGCPSAECLTLANTCRSIADKAQRLLDAGDREAAYHEACRWPDEAGPWR